MSSYHKARLGSKRAHHIYSRLFHSHPLSQMEMAFTVTKVLISMETSGNTSADLLRQTLVQLSGIRDRTVTPCRRGVALARGSLTGTVHTGLQSSFLFFFGTFLDCILEEESLPDPEVENASEGTDPQRYQGLCGGEAGPKTVVQNLCACARLLRRL